METTKEYKFNYDKCRIRVGIQEDWFVADPRSYSTTEFTTRDHRYYNIPKEFSFDWDAYDDGDMTEIEKMDKDYYIFFLDCYEHDFMVRNLLGRNIDWKRDRSGRVGLMRIKKTDVEDDKTALEIALNEIKTYNQWLRWEIYEYIIERLVKWTSEDWREKFEREFMDWCRWFYSEDEALNDALAEIKVDEN